jgi:hypothetical protein
MLDEAYGKATTKKTWVEEPCTRVCVRVLAMRVAMTIHAATSMYDGHIKCVHDVVQSDRRMSIQDISAEVGLSAQSAHSTLHKDLNSWFLLQDNMPAHRLLMAKKYLAKRDLMT